MPCSCQYNADECDGETAIHYPLQDGGTCAVEPCRKLQHAPDRHYQQDSLPEPPKD